MAAPQLSGVTGPRCRRQGRGGFTGGPALWVEENEWVRFALLEVLRDPGDKETVLDVLLVPCTGELSRRAYLDLVATLRGVRTVRGALAGISRCRGGAPSVA
ncbi:MAG TPA: hypothetical protein GX513_15080 [Firmicutes bacterium]|nr:hypothetical protein [Bacillota bacterium]